MYIQFEAVNHQRRALFWQTGAKYKIYWIILFKYFIWIIISVELLQCLFFAGESLQLYLPGCIVLYSLFYLEPAHHYKMMEL